MNGLLKMNQYNSKQGKRASNRFITFNQSHKYYSSRLLNRSHSSANTSNYKYKSIQDKELSISKKDSRELSNVIIQGLNDSMSTIKQLSARKNLRHTKILEKNLKKSKMYKLNAQNQINKHNSSKLLSKSNRLSPMKIKDSLLNQGLFPIRSQNSAKTLKTLSTRDTKFDSKPSLSHFKSWEFSNHLKAKTQNHSQVVSPINKIKFSQSKSIDKKHKLDSSHGSIVNLHAQAPYSNSTSGGEFTKQSAFSPSKFINTDNLASSKASKAEAIKNYPENFINSQRTPLKASDDFLSIIASRLCLLDNEMSHSGKPGPIDTNNKRLKRLKKYYFQFVKKFSLEEGIYDTVFVHSIILAKKVKAALIDKFEFKPKEFMFLYAGCLFLSIKYVVDTEKWFLEDFANIAKFNKSIIHKMELFVLETGLNFNMSLLHCQFEKEYQKTYLNVQKRRIRLLQNSQGK